MKKTTILAMALAMLCAFSACKKEGVFNPKEKLSAIYRSWEYTVTPEYNYYRNMPKYLAEEWNWDGKKLASINYYYYDWVNDTTFTTKLDYTLEMTYDGKRLESISEPGESYKVKFVYDGRKLEKVVLEDNGTEFTMIEVSHDGKKIDKLTFHDYEKGFSASDKMRGTLLRLMLPDMTIANRVDYQLTKAVKKGSKDGNDAIVVYLTWDGDNVSKITVNEREQEITFIYDNKENPGYGFCGMLAVESHIDQFESGLSYLNANNITSITSKYKEYDYDENGNMTDAEWRTSTIDFSYTYDGKWPVTRTFVDSFDEGVTCTETLYFEY